MGADGLHQESGPALEGDVAEKFFQLSLAGIDGMAIILVNYVNEMPIVRDEVLPRLERLKIREVRKH